MDDTFSSQSPLFEAYFIVSFILSFRHLAGVFLHRNGWVKHVFFNKKTHWHFRRSRLRFTGWAIMEWHLKKDHIGHSTTKREKVFFTRSKRVFTDMKGWKEKTDSLLQCIIISTIPQPMNIYEEGNKRRRKKERKQKRIFFFLYIRLPPGERG